MSLASYPSTSSLVIKIPNLHLSQSLPFLLEYFVPKLVELLQLILGVNSDSAL